MKKYMYLYSLLAFLILCVHNLRAMENPADDLSDINEVISQALEAILTTTPTINDDEKTRLEQLIVAGKYSNIPMMTKDDFERFLRNYRFIMRSSGDVRAWYLKYLQAYLDEDDALLIEVKRTPLETIERLTSYQRYFSTKIYPAIVIPLIEYSFYSQLRSAWERGENGHQIIAKWLQMHTLAFMALFPREPIDRFIGQIGLVTMPIQQMSYEQLQVIGQIYKQVFNDMLGWFYK